MRPHSHELVTFKDEWDHMVCLQNVRDLYFFSCYFNSLLQLQRMQHKVGSSPSTAAMGEGKGAATPLRQSLPGLPPSFILLALPPIAFEFLTPVFKVIKLKL